MIFELCYDNRWLYFGITIMQGRYNSLTLAPFGINSCLLTKLPLLIFGQISGFWVLHIPCPNPTQTPVHCMISPSSCRENSNPLVFRVSFGFIIAREDYPVIAPRVTFLRERFWANGVESDRTVENPEPFLASLPSLRAVSLESEPLQRYS